MRLFNDTATPRFLSHVSRAERDAAKEGMREQRKESVQLVKHYTGVNTLPSELAANIKTVRQIVPELELGINDCKIEEFIEQFHGAEEKPVLGYKA
jgi:hypothetical protein